MNNKEIMKTNVCSVCEQGNLHLEHSEAQHMIGGAPVMVAHQIHWCDACGLEITTDEDAKLNARSMRAAERRAQGKLTGEDILNLRKKLDITQEVAGRIFGGGPIAFSKYEKNDVSPADGMDNLLWVATRRPSIVCDLAARNSVQFTLPDNLVTQGEPEIKFEAAGLEVGRAFIHTIAAAIDEAKSSWMPGAFRALKERQASNQSSLTLTEQSLSGLAA